MSKSGDILKEWNKIKLQKDIQQRSILDAVGRYESGAIAGNGDTPSQKTEQPLQKTEVTTKTEFKPSEIPEGYDEALKYLKQAKSVLTPAFLEKHPEVIGYYDAITKMGVERGKEYQKEMPNVYLNTSEQKELLNKAGLDYNKYKEARLLVNSFQSKAYPELHFTSGTKESAAEDDLLYGIRAATEYEYTGNDKAKTKEQNLKEAQEYSTVFGRDKDIPLNNLRR